MLSIFEEEAAAARDRVLDVWCASCIGQGVHRDGVTCEWCHGAGWLILGDHEPPCIACNNPRRALRPAPPGIWWEAS